MDQTDPPKKKITNWPGHPLLKTNKMMLGTCCSQDVDIHNIFRINYTDISDKYTDLPSGSKNYSHLPN